MIETPRFCAWKTRCSGMQVKADRSGHEAYLRTSSMRLAANLARAVESNASPGSPRQPSKGLRSNRPCFDLGWRVCCD